MEEQKSPLAPGGDGVTVNVADQIGSYADGSFLEPPAEETQVVEQKEPVKPQHEVIAERLTAFRDKLNLRVVELMTVDRTQEKDYKIEVIDNPWVEGIVHATETWVGGERSTRVFDERYQTKSEWDDKPGDIDMGTTVDKGGYREVGIGMHIRADGSLRQEINCTTETAQNALYDGKGALMKGDFFKWAGQGKMVENVRISPDGFVSRNRYWSEDKWLGHNDRYLLRVVTENNGVVESGNLEHGIALNLHPKMTVVS